MLIVVFTVFASIWGLVAAFPDPDTASAYELTKWMITRTDPFDFFDIEPTSQKKIVDDVYKTCAAQWAVHATHDKVPHELQDQFSAAIEARYQSYKAHRNVARFNPAILDGADVTSFDDMLAHGRFRDHLGLTIPIPAGAKIAWQEYVDKYIHTMNNNSVATIYLGHRRLINLVLRDSGHSSSEYRLAVNQSVAIFKPWLEDFIDMALIDGSRADLVHLIKSLAIPMYGSKANMLIGETLKSVAWTILPSYSRFFTFHKSVRLAYTNSLPPLWRKFNQRLVGIQVFAFKFMVYKLIRNDEHCEYLFNRLLWSYLEILMEPVVRIAASELVFDKSINRDESKRLARGMKILGKLFKKYGSQQSESNTEAFKKVV